MYGALDQGLSAIANFGFPLPHRYPNQKPVTGNNEPKVRSILLLGGITRMTIHEAIKEFRAAAIAKADFAAPASKDHALHKRMADAFEFLYSQGSDGNAAFITLLHDESPHVRGWVAAQLLADGDESAVPVLEQLATQPGIPGFTAGTTLKEFRAGRLRSPFKSHAAQQAGCCEPRDRIAVQSTRHGRGFADPER